MLPSTPALASTLKTDLHYLFIKKEGRYAAHCLDIDLVATGSTLEEAKRHLHAVVTMTFQHAASKILNDGMDIPLHVLGPQAPSELWKQFYTCRESIDLDLEIPLSGKTREVWIKIQAAETEE